MRKLKYLAIVYINAAVWVLQRNRTNSMYIFRKREIYFKELAHVLWEMAGMKFAGQASSLEILTEVNIVVLSPKVIWRSNSFFLGRIIVFSL